MAKCIALPKLPELALPAGLNFSPPALSLPGLPDNVCCKLPPLPVPSLPIKIPPLALAGALTVLKAAQAAINKALQSAALTCPRE
jgi:hypothetical protein